MNQTSPTYQKIKDAVEAIRAKTSLKPQVGIILGSGLGPVAKSIIEMTEVSYSEIPNFRQPSIEGHAGKLILGKLGGISVACLQGRFHLYEGHSMEDVVFPTRTLCALGIHTLLLTNAAGAVNTRFRPGDLMLIEDHLNLTGDNPLKGPNLNDFGPRFPDMSEAYHPDCLQILKATAIQNQIPIQQGVYAGLLGPSFETPAEIRMLRTLGADAVGMSTVCETLTANHAGIRVAGISCITNEAAGLSQQKITHAEVMEVSKIGAKKLAHLLNNAIPQLAARS